MGHSVLVVPVPELDDYVRARTEHYDASFLGTSDDFVNAHITLLGPWMAAPTSDDLATVGDILDDHRAFDFTLNEVVTFPDGLINLVPAPSEPFSRITAALVAAFPQCPPYAGAFPDPVPHLTLDRRAPGIDAESVRRDLGTSVPVSTRAHRVDLQWWDNDACRRLHSWELR